MKRILLLLSLLGGFITTYSQVQQINVGTSANDNTGDKPRAAFIKARYNFNYLDLRIDSVDEDASTVGARLDSLIDAGVGGGSSFSDASFILQDDATPSKQLQFQLSGISTGVTRTLTAPNSSGTIATESYALPRTGSTLINTAWSLYGSGSKELSASDGNYDSRIRVESTGTFMDHTPDGITTSVVNLNSSTASLVHQAPTIETTGIYVSDGQITIESTNASHYGMVYTSEPNYLEELSVAPIKYYRDRVLAATSSLNFPSTVNGTSSDLTITVTGAALSDAVNLGVPHVSVVPASCYTAWVSSANTVTVRFSNFGSTPVDPSAGSFKVKVIKDL